jgi:hypothetical protein
MASVVVQQAISQQAVALGHQLLRHGGHTALVQVRKATLPEHAAEQHTTAVGQHEPAVSQGAV